MEITNYLNLTFIKKDIKKVVKYLHIVIDETIVYVSDNLGYVYAYDYEFKKLFGQKTIKFPLDQTLRFHKIK